MNFEPWCPVSTTDPVMNWGCGEFLILPAGVNEGFPHHPAETAAWLTVTVNLQTNLRNVKWGRRGVCLRINDTRCVCSGTWSGLSELVVIECPTPRPPIKVHFLPSADKRPLQILPTGMGRRQRWAEHSPPSQASPIRGQAVHKI